MRAARLLPFLLFILISCNKQELAPSGQIGGSNSKANSIIIEKPVPVVEMAKLNAQASSSQPHQISTAEIDELFSEGLISEEEKEELLKLVSK